MNGHCAAQQLAIARLWRMLNNDRFRRHRRLTSVPIRLGLIQLGR